MPWRAFAYSFIASSAGLRRADAEYSAPVNCGRTILAVLTGGALVTPGGGVGASAVEPLVGAMIASKREAAEVPVTEADAPRRLVDEARALRPPEAWR